MATRKDQRKKILLNTNRTFRPQQMSPTMKEELTAGSDEETVGEFDKEWSRVFEISKNNWNPTCKLEMAITMQDIQ